MIWCGMAWPGMVSQVLDVKTRRSNPLRRVAIGDLDQPPRSAAVRMVRHDPLRSARVLPFDALKFFALLALFTNQICRYGRAARQILNLIVE